MVILSVNRVRGGDECGIGGGEFCVCGVIGGVEIVLEGNDD